MLSRRVVAPRPRLIAVAIAAALIIPVTFSSSEGMQTSELCASGNCCAEVNSFCTANGKTAINYYSSISGVCEIHQQSVMSVGF